MNTTDIAVVYQDQSLLILNKPAGIVIHPTYKHADGDTLWDALLQYLQGQPVEPWQMPDLPDDPEWLGAPETVKVMLRERRETFLRKKLEIQPRPCLLHRLDRDTSGIVALARTESARRHVIRQFHEHTVEKRYLAVAQCVAPRWVAPLVPLSFARRLADGRVEGCDAAALLTLAAGDELVIDGPLQRDSVDRRRCVVGPEGQEARTLVRVVRRHEGYMLLEVRPVTGRTHQIRAHLAAAGYALVGDQVYAPVAEEGRPEAALRRQFLHAASLTLRNYPDNELCTFTAPLPADLMGWLARYMPPL
jgi:23S rRNA pseudouridine1911/1915/1917 synthase